MIKPEKIIIMTQMAVYEKEYGEKDSKINKFFRHDYLYWSNFWTRLFALVGCMMIIGIYALNMIFVEGADIFTLDYKSEAYKAGFFIVVVLSIYTFINSIIATKRYSAAENRIKRQIDLAKRLEDMDEGHGSKLASRSPEGDALYYHGDAIRNKRSYNRTL